MVERLCECGRPVAPERVRRRDRGSRFCSSWCDSREGQGLPPQEPPAGPVLSSPPSVVVPIGDGASVVVPSPAHPSQFSPPRSVASVVRRTLEAASLVDTWEGAAALDLASAMDAGPSGSARAALARELRAVMGDLMTGVDEAGSRVGAYRDEMAERRRARQAGA